MKHYIISFLFFLIFFGFSDHISAQYNIKVGYRGGYSSMMEINKVIDDFNLRYPTLEDKLDRFNFVNGLELGLRYRIGAAAIEIGWCNVTDRSDALGRLPNNQSFQDKWFLSLTEFSFGLENFLGEYFGYGATMGYSTLRFKTDIEGSRRKKRLAAEDSAFNSRFYLFYQYPGEKVSIAFKPYVQLPWRAYNISDFDQDLNVQLDPGYRANPEQKEKFMVFGLSILLYNGKQ